METQVNLDLTVDAFVSLAGEDALTDGRVLCRTAAETVESWLDPKKENQITTTSISYAAATIAFYRYTLKSSGNAQSIKAGDITVNDSSEKSVEYAKSLMHDALHSIEHLFLPRQFAFIKTEVL